TPAATRPPTDPSSRSLPMTRWMGWMVLPRELENAKGGRVCARLIASNWRLALLNGNRTLHSGRQVRRADVVVLARLHAGKRHGIGLIRVQKHRTGQIRDLVRHVRRQLRDRKSTRLNSSHLGISYAVFCLKTKMIARPCDTKSR